MEDRLFSGDRTAAADAAPARNHRSRLLLLACLLPWSLVPGAAAAATARADELPPLRAGIYQNEPRLFHSAEGAARGFFPEVIDRIADEIDRPLEYVPCTWAGCLDALSRGELDVLPDVAWSAEREQSIRFGREAALYLVSHLYSRPGEQPERFDALNGSRVAVIRDSIQHDHLRDLTVKRDWDLRLIAAPDMREVLLQVESGRADYGVVNDFFHSPAMDGLDVVRTRFAIQPTALYLAWRPDIDPALVTRIDAELARLKAQPDSVYYDAYRRWLVPPEEDPVPAFLYLLLAGLMVAVVGLAAAAVVYRRRARGSASALIMSRERMAAVAEAVGIGLWDWDAERDELHWDVSMRRLYGLDAPADECTVAAWLEHVHPDDRKRVTREAGQAIRRKRPLDTEFRIVRRGGEVRRLKANGRYIDDPRQGEHMVGINLDVTEMRSLEEQLQQAQKMESLGALTGGIAHDFNNLLMVISNNLELAEADLPERERALLLQEARQASERGAELTRRLLTFSRRQVLDAHPADLNEQVRRTTSLLDRIIPEAIRIEVSLDPQPLHARVDIGQLENALINLAINARDAMPDGGRLRIRSLSLEMDSADPDHPEDLAPGRYQLIEVEDDGTGMPAGCREHAFDPFFTTKEMGHGTGLGLSMVHGFIRQSGGDVRIDSEPDRGTRVRLYFPAVSAPTPRAAAPAAKKATVRDARRYRILVVEDDPNVRRLVTKMLDSLQMEHRTATDGIQALRILDQDPQLELVLSDVVMPGGMDGIELAHRILKLRPDLAVVLMSGYSGSRETRTGEVPDPVIWLSKPFTREDLATAIHSAMADPEARRAGT